jgi:flagellar hook-associated protein 1 FlgK
MSLTLALNAAVSGLQVNQAALQVTSNNITNANTPGYTRKIASQEALSIGGIGTGVKAGAVNRQIDSYLDKQVRTASSDLASLTAQSGYFEQMQALFGSPGSNSSVSASLDQFETALQALAVTPDDPTLRSQVVAKGVIVARQLNDMSSGVQDLRLQADREIAGSIGIINQQLTKIASLNDEISRLTALHQSTAELEDQRDGALNKLSEQMDVSTFARDTGEIVVLNHAGTVMVDGDPSLLSYTPAASMQAASAYPGSLQPIMLGGVDITQDFRSGRIAGLLNLRDNTLPDLGAQTSELALGLRDQVNRAHNEGSGLPAAATLTGSRPQTAATAAPFTGPLQIALVNSDGSQAFTATIDTADVSPPNAANFAAAIKAAGVAAGFPAAWDASESGGVVTIAGAGYGIALSGGTVVDPDPVSGGTKSVSDFLHLNDFFVATNSTGGDVAAVIAVRSDIAANPNLMARGTLRLDTRTGTWGLSSGDGSVAQGLAAALSGATDFPAAGGMAAMQRTLADYGAAILSKNATDAQNLTSSLGSKQALFDQLQLRSSSISGVNIDEEMASLITLQNAYSASARLVNTVSDMLDTLMNIGR